MVFGSGVIFIVVIAIIFVGLINVYNSLVKKRNEVKNSFSQIDIQLKRRYDLIPNLVETAKAYLKHEKETLENVIRARNQALLSLQTAAVNSSQGDKIKNLTNADGNLNQALGRLMMVMESYPDLKADHTIRQLMEELSSTENKIAFARQAFNDSVMTFNNTREVFPNNIFASMFGFEMANAFEVTNPVEKENIKVQF